MECVCGRSLFAKQENQFSAIFSKRFFTKRRHFKELQVKLRICSIVLKFGQPLVYDIENKNFSVNYNFQIFFLREPFLCDRYMSF